MNYKAKNIISVMLPIITLFAIAFALKTQPTGFAVYENKSLYKINGNISIALQDKIPLDSYIRVKIGDYSISINIVDFMKKSMKKYMIIKENGENFIVGGGVYTADFDSLGIIEGFEKGKHAIRTEIIYRGAILYSDEEIMGI